MTKRKTEVAITPAKKQAKTTEPSPGTGAKVAAGKKAAATTAATTVHKPLPDADGCAVNCEIHDQVRRDYDTILKHPIFANILDADPLIIQDIADGSMCGVQAQRIA